MFVAIKARVVQITVCFLESFEIRKKFVFLRTIVINMKQAQIAHFCFCNVAVRTTVLKVFSEKFSVFRVVIYWLRIMFANSFL